MKLGKQICSTNLTGYGYQENLGKGGGTFLLKCHIYSEYSAASKQPGILLFQCKRKHFLNSQEKSRKLRCATAGTYSMNDVKIEQFSINIYSYETW